MTRTTRAASAASAARAVSDSGAPVSRWPDKQPTASAPASPSPATLETNHLAFISRTCRPVSAVASWPTTFTQLYPIVPQVCIHPKEVAQLTGTKYGTAKVLLQRIRAELNKPARAYVSVAGFCQYTHLPEEEVSRALNQGQRS